MQLRLPVRVGVASLSAAEQEPGFWTVAVCRPAQERRAQDNARDAGYETYLPMTDERLSRSRSRAAVLFPSYLFVRVVDSWYALLSVVGVSSLLMVEDRPGRVPNRYLRQLREREGADGLVHLRRARFKRGQRARVDSGRLDGFDVLFEEMRGIDRALVLVSLLGQWARVELDERTLSAVA